MEKQFCFNYEHYAALAGLSDADRPLVAEAQRATENASYSLMSCNRYP